MNSFHINNFANLGDGCTNYSANAIRVERTPCIQAIDEIWCVKNLMIYEERHHQNVDIALKN